MFLYTIRVLRQIILGARKHVDIKFPSSNKLACLEYDVPMRCTLIDIDIFLHMNNSNYLRTAELARWRIFPQSGALDQVRNNTLFLAVENNAKYFRPIDFNQKYIIRTTLTVEDNKWMNYKHTFIQDPTTVKPGKEPHVYCVVDCKAVLKEKSGKTIKLTDAAKLSPFYQKVLEQQQILDQLREKEEEEDEKLAH